MVFNANFNNISVILWPTGLLVEETGVPGENHRPAASHSFKTLLKKPNDLNGNLTEMYGFWCRYEA